MIGSAYGKVALVTGGAGGIGSTIAAHLHELGATVAVADLGGSPSPELAQHAEISAHVLDVRDEASCAAVVDEVLGRHGRLDVLVNNAGIMVRADPLGTTLEDWQRVLDTNLTGAFRMCRAAHAALQASGGCIVNVSSTHAFLAARGATAYSVSKAGVSHLTRLLALEWASDGIRVNAVAPTVVPTAMSAELLRDPEYVRRKLGSIPLGMPIPRETVAAAVAYLASTEAAAVTGHILVLDGGESLA